MAEVATEGPEGKGGGHGKELFTLETSAQYTNTPICLSLSIPLFCVPVQRSAMTKGEAVCF